MTTVTVESDYNTVVVTEQTGDVTVVASPSATSAIVEVNQQGPSGPQGPIGPAGPAGVPGPPKAITIAQPKPNDQFTLFYTQQSTVLTQVLAVVRGVSANVGFELRYGSDRSAVGTLATVPENVTNTTTGEPIAIQNMPIPADNFLWIAVTSVSGQVEELNVSVEI